MQKVALSKRRIEALDAPGRGRLYVYDAKVPGLAVCVTAAGAKTFYLCRRVSGRYERIRIGRHPAVTVEQARREAARLNGQIAEGQNPQARRRAARGEATFGALFDAFLDHHAKERKRTWRDDAAQFDRHLQPLAKRKASAITRADVKRLHASIGRECGKYAANRALALVSAVFNVAGREAGIEFNPAKGVGRFREQSRDRFLRADELRAFFKALADEPNPTWRDLFVLLLLTGARRANVQAMRWTDLDLDRGLWLIPETESKTGEPLICILAGPAVAILRRRLEESAGGEYVFPAASKSGHVEEPKKAWRAVLDRAGIKGVRIHDLRRTLGSWQAATGASLSIIGRALGHKSVTATAVYARLDLDPVRQSVEAATRAILDAAGERPAGLLPPANEKETAMAERPPSET